MNERTNERTGSSHAVIFGIVGPIVIVILVSVLLLRGGGDSRPAHIDLDVDVTEKVAPRGNEAPAPSPDSQ